MEASGAISSRVAVISPSIARGYLDRLHAKTKVDQRLLQSYARDMQDGRWAINGAPIVLSESGHVLDGRHRLLASVQSNSSFQTLLVEGISATSYETIDAVRKRALADVLAIRNEIHGRPLAAALRIIWCYSNSITPGAGKGPSPTSLLALLEEYPSIRDSVRPALAAMPLLPHGCGIALHYLMNQVSSSKADRFIAAIGDATLSADFKPVHHLREVLGSLRGQGGNRKQSYLLAVTIKSWNAFQTGADLRLLKYAPDRESFPRISGFKESPGPLFESKRADWRPGAHDCSDVRARVVQITADFANELLARNRLNRHVSASVVNKYARDMNAGRWHLNGQTIKFSSSGKLLDGQHRLEAAKKSKKPFDVILVEGLPEQSFSSLDIGRRRSVADILREKGESHTVVLASALRWLWMIRNEVVLAANSSPTNGEMLRLLDDNPNIRQSLRHVVQIREIMGSGIACSLHYVFASIDQAKSNDFFSRLIDGVQLSEQSPIYHLRERLIRTRTSHRVRLAEAERVALTIKAWNAFRSDRPIQILAWRNRGSAREALPVPC